jgi:hypothetical protein
VKKVLKVARMGGILNPLLKTKEEVYPDLRTAREDFDKEKREQAKAETRMIAKREKEARQEKKKQKELESYKDLFDDMDNLTSTDDLEEVSYADYEADFM